MILSRFGKKIRRNKKLVLEMEIYLNLFKLIKIKLKITKYRSYPKLLDTKTKEIPLRQIDNLDKVEIIKLVALTTQLDKESPVDNRLI